MKALDLWEEFIVEVELPNLPGHKIPMCGLCGNTGMVDTIGIAHDSNQTVQCGIRAHCI